FPYIRVPRSVWLTQVLLYWDQVGSIVPYEYINKPEELGPYMQQLLMEELVVQIQPGAYLHSLPRFAAAFAEYLDHLGSELTARQRAFRAGQVTQVHREKLSTRAGGGVPSTRVAQIHMEKLDEVTHA